MILLGLVQFVFSTVKDLLNICNSIGQLLAYFSVITHQCFIQTNHSIQTQFQINKDQIKQAYSIRDTRRTKRIKYSSVPLPNNNNTYTHHHRRESSTPVNLTQKDILLDIPRHREETTPELLKHQPTHQIPYINYTN